MINSTKMTAPATRAKKVKCVVRFFNFYWSKVSLSVLRDSALIPLEEFYPTATTTTLACPFETNYPAFKNGLLSSDLFP